MFTDGGGFVFLVPDLEQALPPSDALQSTDEPALNPTTLCSMCEQDAVSVGPVMTRLT